MLYVMLEQPFSAFLICPLPLLSRTLCFLASCKTAIQETDDQLHTQQ
jgi:hypothetical protein